MIESAAHKLIDLSVEMNRQGLPLMQRILPADTPAEQWTHYPLDDAVSPSDGGRYFYHCHPPEERGEHEHGHFHMFLPLSLFPRECAVSAPLDDGINRAEVVHFAALSVASSGLPIALFTTNRWVTDEWMFPAEAIIAQLVAFDLEGAEGDPLVNAWLTNFVALAKDQIADLLTERDQLLSPKGWPGEDRAIEVTSSTNIDLQSLVETALTPDLG